MLTIDSSDGFLRDVRVDDVEIHIVGECVNVIVRNIVRDFVKAEEPMLKSRTEIHSMCSMI